MGETLFFQNMGQYAARVITLLVKVEQHVTKWTTGHSVKKVENIFPICRKGLQQ